MKDSDPENEREQRDLVEKSVALQDECQKIKDLIKEGLEFADQIEKRIDGIETDAIPSIKKKFTDKNAAVDQCDELFEEVEHAIGTLEKDLNKELEKVNEVMQKLDKVNPLKNPQVPSQVNPDFTEQTQKKLELAQAQRDKLEGELDDLKNTKDKLVNVTV